MGIILNAMSDDTTMNPMDPNMDEGTEVKPEGAETKEDSEGMATESTTEGSTE